MLLLKFKHNLFYKKLEIIDEDVVILKNRKIFEFP